MKSFVLTTQESELNTRVLIDRIACRFELGNSLINLRERILHGTPFTRFINQCRGMLHLLI